MLAAEAISRPFVTIGVPTYNRHELLRKTLQSILAQSFGDFEVIVGNDYTAETLTGEMLGISDPRIRFVNHPHNLREVGNMNALLGMATGRYFTWLFDDDLYEPDFLRIAHDSLAANEFPPAFFSAYGDLRTTDVYRPRHITPRPTLALTGRQFLDGYFSGRLKIVSTCGLFDVEVLRDWVGGVEELCDSAIGVYCEYLFLVRCAQQLERVVYMDAPYVLFHKHAGSWSESNTDLDKYTIAGRELLRRCVGILSSPALADAKNNHLIGLCRIHLTTFAYKSAGFEIARKKYCVGAAIRAQVRLWQEFVKTKLFISAVGATGQKTGFALAKVMAHCCGIVLFQLAYYFYYDNLRKSG